MALDIWPLLSHKTHYHTITANLVDQNYTNFSNAAPTHITDAANKPQVEPAVNMRTNLASLYPRLPTESATIHQTQNPNTAFCNTSANFINSRTRNSAHSVPHFQNQEASAFVYPDRLFSNHLVTDSSPRTTLSVSQTHARNSLPKELPCFSGDPVEWPIFSSTYDWSTRVCGFTDTENLIRLQKALKGEALRAVQHTLIHPSSVPAALSTLKLLYGQPERILCSLKARISSTPRIDPKKLESYTSFAISVKGFQATLEACGLFNELNNSSLVQELVSKLPTYLQLSWGAQKIHLLQRNQNANIVEFANWIYEIGISASITSQPSTNDERNKANQMQKGCVNTHNNDLQTCIVCGGKCKDVITCQRFLSATRSEKRNLVKFKKLCKRCLGPLTDRNCLCKNTCGIDNCPFKHHRLLHRINIIDTEPTPPVTTADNNNVIGLHSPKNMKVKEMSVLFKIIPITVYGKNTSRKILAFIDEGSSISLIDENLAKELNLNGNKRRLCLTWTGDVQRVEECSQEIHLSLEGSDKRVFKIQAHTVQQRGLPRQSMQYEKLRESFPHLANLPIENFESGSPLLLIGANNWSLGIPIEVREGHPNEPVAVRTRLGWLIYGNKHGNDSVGQSFNFHSCNCNNEHLNTNLNLMKEFFTLDSIGISATSSQVTSKEDERAIELLNKNTKQLTDGHYETGLLWRDETVKLPDSLLMAKRRLICLKKKLRKEPELQAIFDKTIQDYETKGYITKLTRQQVSQTECGAKVWYLPTFAVFNKNKPGKARIVWDAAAKTNGFSLNCMLLTGPDLLASLPSILLRFRQKQVAICGDIKEMFHQVVIRPEDRHAQRFLWRSCEANNEPDVYVMNVMIFGAACTSQYVKNLNACKFESKLPAACAAIIQNHYVDDYLDSVDSINEAIELASQVKFVHAQGGFLIRNWSSNKRTVLENLNEEATTADKGLPQQETMTIEKVLGMFWVPEEDVITFKLSNAPTTLEILSLQTAPTKRQVLQLVMSLYDPLGLIANIVTYAKMLLQDIWRSQVGWDEPIKQREYTKWQNWTKFIPKLQHIKIDRCYLAEFSNYQGLDVQVHTFVDASENGYAAASYFRISNDKTIICTLVMAKARVSPLKMISIPRLELMAALIGARLAKFVKQSHTIKIHRRYFWSDSQTVLSWLRSDQRNYHQFVAFRVSEILELTNLNEWHWVPGKLNVADEATKSPKNKRLEINAQDRWFRAPDFLYHSKDEWPAQSVNFTPATAELRKHVCIVHICDPIIDVTRFSNWKRLVRATAYFLRVTAKWLGRPSHSEEFTSNE